MQYITDAPERPRLWARWARELQSDVVSIRFFPMPFAIVTLNSYEAIRDAFAGPDSAEALAGRPRSKLGEIANPGYLGELSSTFLPTPDYSYLISQRQRLILSYDITFTL